MHNLGIPRMTANLKPLSDPIDQILQVLLFVAGYRLARSSGRTPWSMGISMVITGALMVGLCIALGG